jgi:hypothetical protein
MEMLKKAPFDLERKDGIPMWNPETFVNPYEGYISYRHKHYYVKRDGVRARNWEALEAEAREAVFATQAEYWSLDLSGFYPLLQSLADKADFPPRPSEREHFQQLSQRYDTWPKEYDSRGRLIVHIYALTGQEQREALDVIKNMDDISPESAVARTNESAHEKLPNYLPLHQYLDMPPQRIQDAHDFDFDR